MATQQPAAETQSNESEEKREQVPVKKSAQAQGPLERVRNPAERFLRRLRRRALTPFDPWAESPLSLMRRMSDDFDRMFGDALSRGFADDFFAGMPDEEGSLWSPRLEQFERDGELVIRADLPGIKKDDLKIEVMGQSLIIEGERKSEHEEERPGWYRTEREYGEFRRIIPLPEGADANDAVASFDGGVLEIKVKKPQQQQGRRIEIGGAEQGEQKAEPGKGEEESPKIH